MKNILLIFALLLTAFIGKAQEDIFQMSVRTPNMATPNVVRIVIRPVTNRTGQINTFQFAVSIPVSALPIPTATITSLVPGLSFAPAIGSQENGSGQMFNNFTFLGDGNATVANTNYVSGTEYPIADITFSGGTLSPQTIRGSSYPDGGTNGQSYFYMALGGIQTVNRPAQYYGASTVVNSTFETGYSYVSLTGVILPTKFLSFFATKSDDVANLTWTVDNEENNAYFNVERSLDGRSFTNVLQVQALRNGRPSNSYTTPDANISRLGVKVIYYRIKQVEASGQVTYSEIRQVNLIDKNFVASIYPNPVKNSTKLIIDAPEAAKASIVIRDATGKTVKAISLQLVKGINQQQLDASMFAAGDYNVTIISEKLNQTIKMTKTN